ncbi:MAG: hypothetical protein QM778_19670 [Myxococcales bacterium]
MKSWRLGVLATCVVLGCSGGEDDDVGGDDGGSRGSQIDSGRDDPGGDGDGDPSGRDAGNRDGGRDTGSQDGGPQGGLDAGGMDGGDTQPGNDGGNQSALANISAFSGPNSACAGNISLNYSFTGSAGTITPGDIQLNPGSGQTSVLLSANTEYTLEVSGSGGPKTAKVSVSALPSPNATLTAPATAQHAGTLSVSVPTQAGVTYAWSVASGDANIQGSTSAAQASVVLGATGNSISLKVDVTSGSNSCTATTTKSIPIPCAAPTLVSTDRAQAAGTPQYIPGNEGTRPFAVNASGTLWATYLVSNPNGSATYNLNFTRRIGGAWQVPASSPTALNTASSKVFDVKVATNDAGDATFAWVETSDNSTYSVRARGYKVSSNTWTAIQTLGTTWDNGGPVFVQMDQADTTGKAMIAWIGGPNKQWTPHLRTFTLSTATLGTDVPLRTNANNGLPDYLVDLDFDTRGALTGFISWAEQVADSADEPTLFALHLTNGVPDTVGGGALDIKTIVDPLKQTDLFPETIEQKSDMLAVSENGNAIIVWRSYDGTKWHLNARRYLSGSWGSTEDIRTSANAIHDVSPAIDNAGNAIVATWENGVQFGFTYAAAGAAWAPLAQLTTATNGTPSMRVALDSASGKGVVVYRDEKVSFYAPLRGAFWDPDSKTLGPSFGIDSPVESAPERAQIYLDASGKLNVMFNQLPKTIPNGANSSNSSLEFTTVCE